MKDGDGIGSEGYGLGKTSEGIWYEKIKKCLSESGKSSFELSGYSTTQREWGNINNFVNLRNRKALSDYLKGVSL